MIRRTTPKFAAVCALVAIVAVTGSALAYFTGNGTGTAAAAVTQLTAPTINTATPATGGTVAVSWKAVTAPGAGTVTYYVTRNGEEAGGTCPTVEEPGTVLTCTDSGLAPGVYQYSVTALFHTWTKTSAVVKATVTVGPVAKFAIAGTPTSAAAGAAINLTITAQDEAGGKVTTFTGTHSLTFSGAGNSPLGTPPSVAGNASTTGTTFGTATPLTFATGSTTVASSKNGVLKIYKPGEASITATEGSLTTPVPLEVTITPAAAAKFTVTAANPAPTAGTGDNLTITAIDLYGNVATGYTGSHNVVFGPTGTTTTSPAGNVATVDDSAGNHVAFGTATPIVFTAGVSTVSEGGNGELTLYKSGSLTTLKATEGSITNSTSPPLTVAPSATTNFGTTVALATEPTITGFTLTITAKDAYGNTTPAYNGEKKLTFTGTGTATETSPSGNVAAVVNTAGTAIPLGGQTAITFATTGIATSASSKNGYLRLYKPGTAALNVSDGSSAGTLPALTVTATAKRVAFSGLTASPGTLAANCLFVCSVTTLGNSGTITGKLAITDEYGNVVSNIGASKTATVSVTAGSPVGGISGSPLSFPETGPAISTTAFVYTSPASGSYTTNMVTAASTGFTSATVSASK
jgi:hypothetical protein